MLQTKLKNDYNYSYIENKENKREIKKNNLSTKGFVVYFLVAIIIGVIIVSYISQFVQITHLNYRINTMEEELSILKEKNDIMNIKIAREMSIARIEKIAKNNLNMVEPEKVEIVFLDNDRERIDIIPDDDGNQTFFARVVNKFIEKYATAKAEELK